MSNASYQWARRLIYPIFRVCSRPVVLHADRAAIDGAYVLAANHLSVFDPVLIVGHLPRKVDFLGTVELRRRRTLRWFLGLFNVFYVDRGRRDSGAVREAVRRLKAGRVVGIFPEGGVREENQSALNGGVLQKGAARIAALSRAPVIPCVVLGGRRFCRPDSWLPFRGTRYGLIFGKPMTMNRDGDAGEFSAELANCFRELAGELVASLKEKEHGG